MANIFGVTFDKHCRDEIYTIIDEALEKKSFAKWIVTLNPEILLKADKDVTYKKVLNQADIKIVDGFGIRLVGFIKSMDVGQRVTGVELSEYILDKVKKLDLHLTLVLREDGLSKREELDKYLNEFGIKNFSISTCDLKNLQTNLNKETQILLVGLGAPHQEMFIRQYMANLPILRLVMGVGGTFDIWTNKRRRAPRLLQKTGLEWFWRLLTQPNRLIRIWNAVFVFLYKAILVKRLPNVRKMP